MSRREPVWVVRHQDPLRLNAKTVDWTFAFLDREHIRARVISVVSLFVVAGAAVAINVRQDTLGATGWLQRVRTDLAARAGWAEQSLTDPSFPLLRDYSSIVLLVSLSIYFGVLHHQVRRIDRLPTDLLRTRAITIWPGHQSRVYLDAAADRFRNRMRTTRRLRLVILTVAIVLMAWIARQQFVNGIYPTVVEPLASPHDAYNNWWASVHNPVGFAFYNLFGVTAIYFIILQNVVGVWILAFFVGVRHVVTFGLSTLNPDGYFGWEPFRAVMATVYGSILLHGLALSGFILGFSLRGLWWVALLVGIFVFLNPFYVVMPLVLLRSSMQRAKTERVAALADMVPATPDDPQQIADQATVRDEIALVRKVPSMPFNVRAITAAAIVYVLPLALALIQLLTMVH